MVHAMIDLLEKVDCEHGKLVSKFSEDPPVTVPTGFSCLAPRSSLEPVGRAAGRRDGLQLNKELSPGKSCPKWNGIVVSSLPLEVFKYRLSSDLCGKLYCRPKHQRGT